MKMKTEIMLKDGTVYADKNFNKEKVVELIEKLGTLIDDGSVESMSITKSIFTKEIKEKYFDAFEEAVESIRAFFSEESNENCTKEAESFFGAEMLKLKLEQEEKGRENDHKWYSRKIDKLEENLTKMEEDRDALFVKLTEAEDIIHKLKEENTCLLEKNQSIPSWRLHVENMSLKNELEEEAKEKDLLFMMNVDSQDEIEQLRDCNRKLKEDNEHLYEENTILGNRIDVLNEEGKEYLELEEAMLNAMDSLEEEIETKDFAITGLMNTIKRINEVNDSQVSTIRKRYMTEISSLKEEIEKDNKDLLEQRDTIDRLNREIINGSSNRKHFVTIIEEQDNELNNLTNKINELMDEDAGKDSKIKAFQLFLTNTNELVDTMSREIARLNQVIKEDSCLVDSYKAKCVTLNKEIDIIKNRAREIVRAYHQKYEEKIQEIKEYHKEMEHIYESTIARRQQTFDKNYHSLLSELNSLKKRSLWQRIRNKH